MEEYQDFSGNEEHKPEVPVVPVEASEQTRDKSKFKKWFRAFLIVDAIAFLVLVSFGILYFLRSESKSHSYPIIDKPSVVGLKIAYINNDSLTEKYELVKEARNLLDEKKARMEKEIHAEQAELESQYRIWEKNVKDQRYSELLLRNAQEELMRKEQDLYKKSQDYTELLAQEELDRNKVFIDSVLNYLKRFNEVNNYDFILNYASGATILLANDTFDITNEVVRGLNEEWINIYPPKK